MGGYYVQSRLIVDYRQGWSRECGLSFSLHETESGRSGKPRPAIEAVGISLQAEKDCSEHGVKDCDLGAVFNLGVSRKTQLPYPALSCLSLTLLQINGKELHEASQRRAKGVCKRRKSITYIRTEWQESDA